MLRAFRRTRLNRTFATLAVSALLALMVSSPLHDQGDDSLCNVAFGAGDAGTFQIAALDATPRHAQHCMVCHAIQSIRGEQASARYAPPPLDLRLTAAASIAVVPAALVSTRPARAPPLA